MADPALENTCDELKAQYGEQYSISVMIDDGDITVYLPLDEENNIDPPESKEAVEQFFTSRGFSTYMEATGLLVAEPQIK